MPKQFTPERWKQIEDVFNAVVDASPSDRNALLQELASSDDELRREVASLLATDSSSDLPAISPQSTITSVDPVHCIGEHIGDYQLLFPLAINTASEVWCAEQEAGDKVAIKLLRNSGQSDRRFERFQNEIQLLSRFRHPNIARLIDYGASPRGTPYFVMPFTPGMPITDHANERRLTIDQRLGLMVTVCDTVSYAHRFLTVHRDLKPTNILVSENGEPIVLDFGISKMIEEESADAASLTITATHERPMTPAYASPEQVRGETITTATDLHALGLILYELVTGHHPYSDPAHSQASHLFDRICDSNPVAPSEVIQLPAIPLGDERKSGDSPQLIAAFRGQSPSQLRRVLRRGLDFVVLKAIARDPEDRYKSVADLRSDLVNVLESRPVNARRQRRRWDDTVRRHPGRCLVVTAATGLVVATVGTNWFWSSRHNQTATQVTTAQQQLRITKAARNAAELEASATRQQLSDFEQAFRVLRDTDQRVSISDIEAQVDALPSRLRASLAREAIDADRIEVATAMLGDVEQYVQTNSAGAFDAAYTLQRLGRPSMGFEVLVGSAVDLAVPNADLTKQTREFHQLVLQLLLDADRYHAAKAYLLNQVGQEPVDDVLLTITIAEMWRSIGWDEGAVDRLEILPKTLDEWPAEVGLRAVLLRASLFEGARMSELLPPLLARLEWSPLQMGVLRAKGLMLKDSILAPNSSPEGSAAFQSIVDAFHKQGAADHVLALKAMESLAQLADREQLTEQADALRADIWSRTTAIGELGTKLGIRMAAWKMTQTEYQEVQQIAERIAPHLAVYESDLYLHRALLLPQLQTAIQAKDWRGADDVLHILVPIETELWGEDALDTLYVLAAHSFVQQKQSGKTSSQSPLAAVHERIPKLLTSETPSLSSAYLHVAMVSDDTHGDPVFAWLHQYMMQKANSLSQQFQVAAYTLEQIIESCPGQARILTQRLLLYLEQADDRSDEASLRYLRVAAAARELGVDQPDWRTRLDGLQNAGSQAVAAMAKEILSMPSKPPE